MKPGDQITLEPGTKHWFQASGEGAVMYLISSCVRDVLDQFTDPEVVRETKIVD
jgi:D-lyxose ketol-isomerase